MQEAPDLSKIVSVIMQNPALISQIASLVSNGETGSTKEVEQEVSPSPEVHESIAATPTATLAAPTHSRTRRKELLNAMKPYLSEQRRGAIDSMASILDILDVMVRKET